MSFNMAQDIHPTCNPVQVKCTSCGNEFQLTLPGKINSLDVESCNNCHVAYTGVMTISQTGKVEAFAQKYGTIDWDDLA